MAYLAKTRSRLRLGFLALYSLDAPGNTKPRNSTRQELGRGNRRVLDEFVSSGEL